MFCVLSDVLMVLCCGFQKDNQCLPLPFQPHLLPHPSLRLGHPQPRIVLLFPDPLQCTTSKPCPVLCPRPGVPFLRSLSYQNPHPARPSSNAASSSVKWALISPGRFHPSLLPAPTLNTCNLLVAYFILPSDVLGCLYLFLLPEL